MQNMSHGETHFQIGEHLKMSEVEQKNTTQGETVIKIGNTTYIITDHFADNGITVSDKIRRLLDKEVEKTSV